MIEALGPLAPGARVALLSVSGAPSVRNVRRGRELLNAWGLEPVERPTLTLVHPVLPFLAGTDEQRAADLEDAWCDPTIDAIFCVRGGYGSIRMLDLLDVDRMRAARPKPLYGSSDVTALHEWFGAQLGVATWFAPMIATGDLLNDPLATAQLKDAVLGEWRGVAHTREGSEILVPGRAEGVLVGGNLSLLASTLGARGNAPASREGTIVLLEDVFEDGYKIDGYLWQLFRAGWFDGVRAILLGSWKNCPADPTEPPVRPVLEDNLIPLGLPLVWEFGFGHGAAASTLPLGVRAVLDATGPDATLTVG